MKCRIIVLLLIVFVLGGVIVYNLYQKPAGTVIPRHSVSTSQVNLSSATYSATSSSATYTGKQEYLTCIGDCKGAFQLIEWGLTYEKQIGSDFPWIMSTFRIKISLNKYGCVYFYAPDGEELYENCRLEKGVHELFIRYRKGYNATIPSGEYKLVYDRGIGGKIHCEYILHVESNKISIHRLELTTIDTGRQNNRYKVYSLKALIENRGNIPNYFYISIELGSGKVVALVTGIIPPHTAKEYVWNILNGPWFIPVKKPGIYDAVLILDNKVVRIEKKIQLVVPSNGKHVEEYIFENN